MTDELLYVGRVRVMAAKQPEPHALFGKVYEPEIEALDPTAVAPGLGTGLVRVRALDQLVAALAG